MKCKLILLSQDGEKTFALKDGENLIGRDSANTVQVVSEEASRNHAKITITGDKADIEDLKSANGTLVNDKEISKAHLNHGDKIRIAGQAMRFEIAQADETHSYVPKVTSDRSMFATVKAKPVPTASKPKISGKGGGQQGGSGKIGRFFSKLFKK